jgi:hypothetical protein
MSDDLPIIDCEPNGYSGNTPQWRFWCPYCRQHHHHGGDPDAAGMLGHRLPHCHAEASPYRARGYILRVGQADQAHPSMSPG